VRPGRASSARGVRSVTASYLEMQMQCHTGGSCGDQYLEIQAELTSAHAGVGVYYSNEIRGMPPVMLQSVRAPASMTVRLRNAVCCCMPLATNSLCFALLHKVNMRPLAVLESLLCTTVSLHAVCVQVTRLPMLYEVNIVLTNRNVPIPEVLPRERLLVEQLEASGFYHVIARSASSQTFKSDLQERGHARSC